MAGLGKKEFMEEDVGLAPRGRDGSAEQDYTQASSRYLSARQNKMRVLVACNHDRCFFHACTGVVRRVAENSV